MADLPPVTGRKRCISEADDSLMTPKKARALALSTPTKSNGVKRSLPSHLSNVVNTHIRLEEALIPALATTNAPAPVADKDNASRFNMPNVLPHVSIPTLSLDGFKSLVWILEWDGTDLGKVDKHATLVADEDAENPFLVPSTPTTKNWMRGGIGIIVTPTTHLNRTTSRRSAVYGIGIQVDIPKDGPTTSAMNIRTRWIEGAETRKKMVQERVYQWAQMQRKSSREGPSRNSRASSPTPVAIPAIPMASLPALMPPTATSKSPVKIARVVDPKTPSKNKSTIAFPTPGSSSSATSSYATAAESIPSTPSKSDTPFSTPMTARREALYERIRQRSLSNTPTKGSVQVTLGQDKDGNTKTKLVSAEELKRRTMLSKLDGVAECISLLFATNTSSSSIISPQKRRIMRQDEVVRVVVKSSKSPLSDAEANDSIGLLLELCPNFLIPRLIDRDTWLEMPSALSNLSSVLKSPTKRRLPPSPGAITQADLEEELLSRKPGEGSPKRLRVAPQYAPGGRQCMTLREVRERIREELEKD